MSKIKKQNKFCNCQTPSNKEILKPDVNNSFCEKCGCVLLKNEEGIINYTVKTKQNRLPSDLNPISIIKHMKKKTEESYPYIYEEYNFNIVDKQIEERTMKSINIYLKFRKMLLTTLQKLMKIFDYCDTVFYQTLFYLDYHLSQIMSEDMNEKTVLYYLVGYFLCAVKFSETDIYEPTLDSFVNLSKGIYLSMEKIAYYEVLCLKTINYNIFGYSAYDWISQLISNGIVFNCEIKNANEIIIVKGHRHFLLNTINKYAIKLLLNLTFKNIIVKYSPMYIALSLIQIAREKYIDQSKINEKLFINLINLYGIQYDSYKKCYDEIKSEIKDINEENDKNQKDKGKDNYDTIQFISDNHIPHLKGNDRNKSSIKLIKKGKTLCIPNKLKNSKSIVKDNLRTNEDEKENSIIENTKENQGNKDDNKFELTLSEVVSKKKYKINLKKEIIKAKNPIDRLSTITNINILRDNISKLNANPKDRYSLANLNNEDKIELNNPKNKSRSILKKINHVTGNTNKHLSIKVNDVYSNSNISTSVEKDKELVKTKEKTKVHFYPKSNKDMNKFLLELDKNEVQSSTKLSILAGMEKVSKNRFDTNIFEQNRTQNGNKTKKIYRLKKSFDKSENEIKSEKENKMNKHVKTLIEVF